MARSILLHALLAIVLCACATSPLGRSQFILIPDSQMAEMGVSAFAQLKQQTRVSNDRSVNRYVQCITDDVISEVNRSSNVDRWEVVVFDDDSPNAFALPGGKIGVHTGMLRIADSPDQLASVIGHEIAHVLSRHGAERVSQQFAAQTAMTAVQAYSGNSGQGQQVLALLGLGAQVGVLLPFSRTHESEADVYGLELMSRAGYDPRASVQLWRNMQRAGGSGPPEFLSTHPNPQSRIDKLNGIMSEALKLSNAARASGKRPDCRL